MSTMQDLMIAYNKQSLLTFTGKGQSSNFTIPTSNYVLEDIPSDFLTKSVGTSNQAQLLYSAGGFFVDCCLEAPIINTTIQPQYALANMIPVYPTSNRKVTFGFLTEIGDPGVTYPNAPCDDDPEVGDINFCKAELEVGRISYQTKTIELDALIEKACMGVREDFYLVGAVRGVSAIPTPQQLADRDFIQRAAVRRQLSLVGRAMQRDLLKQFWTGDPTNATRNTASGGRKEFWGMMNLVANDYGTAAKPWVTGTNCAQLNSDVKTFPGCVGNGTDSIYAYMQAVEQNRYNFAAYAGLLPTTWVWVMHPILWNELVKALPCEMMGNGCVSPAGQAQTQIFSNGMEQAYLRNQLETTMQVSVNGRTYDVVLDSSLPVVQAGAAPNVTYTGDIFFLPLTVAGDPVLYWNYKDYRTLDQQLNAVPTNQAEFRGWTDSGHFHHVIEHKRRCFIISTKGEFNLVFKAPHLAGRLSQVCVKTLQAMPNPTI